MPARAFRIDDEVGVLFRDARAAALKPFRPQARSGARRDRRRVGNTLPAFGSESGCVAMRRARKSFIARATPWPSPGSARTRRRRTIPRPASWARNAGSRCRTPSRARAHFAAADRWWRRARPRPRFRRHAAGVHRERAAHRAGNAREKFRAREIVQGGEARDLRAGHAGVGVDLALAQLGPARRGVHEDRGARRPRRAPAGWSPGR